MEQTHNTLLVHTHQPNRSILHDTHHTTGESDRQTDRQADRQTERSGERGFSAPALRPSLSVYVEPSITHSSRMRLQRTTKKKHERIMLRRMALHSSPSIHLCVASFTATQSITSTVKLTVARTPLGHQQGDTNTPPGGPPASAPPPADGATCGSSSNVTAGGERLSRRHDLMPCISRFSTASALGNGVRESAEWRLSLRNCRSR
mmetsp:Transcript_40786/g.101972  ORF Transcript_40786/g.101972 Transcript_40786/m.101972 type:complete len:205 (-) Transcript_40786:208-822(-)